MYIIMVYDVNEERVARVLKTARKYLTWVQNSVLEGEITEVKFKKLKKEVLEIIEEKEDSISFYILPSSKAFRKENYGVVKNDTDFLI